MKKNRLLLAILLGSMLCISACGSKDEEKKNKKITALESVNSGDYRLAIPYASSDARQTHIQFNRSTYDVDAVGEGLLRYSKEHFNPDNYYLQEGQLLDRDTLQAGLTYGDKEGLLGSKSTDNPYGLNPEDGSSMPAEEGVTITAKAGSGGTIPVGDVFEVNFIEDLEEDAEIKGISLAIVLNPNVNDANGESHVISDENLKVYGEEAGRNLVAYLKKQPEIGSNTPILVALFKADSSDDSLPGSFIAVGYGKGTINQFDDVNENWIMFPGDTAESTDSQLLSQFNAIKDSLHTFLPNDTGIVGKGFFVDNRILKMQINVISQCKDYTEKMAIVQYTRELLSNFTSTDMEITVKIDADNDTFAMIKRNKGKSDSDVIMY